MLPVFPALPTPSFDSLVDFLLTYQVKQPPGLFLFLQGTFFLVYSILGWKIRLFGSPTPKIHSANLGLRATVFGKCRAWMCNGGWNIQKHKDDVLSCVKEALICSNGQISVVLRVKRACLRRDALLHPGHIVLAGSMAGCRFSWRALDMLLHCPWNRATPESLGQHPRHLSADAWDLSSSILCDLVLWLSLPYVDWK